jgi:prepilin-type N-terminal cleavage/methylation domain-containing protein
MLKKGFTLIELMIVIAVIGILAAIALVGLGQAQKAARDVQRKDYLNGIRTALECYYGVMGGYPTTITWNTLRNSLNPTSPATTCINTDTIIDPYRSTPVGAGGTVTGSTAYDGGLVRYTYTPSGSNGYTLTVYGEAGALTLTNPN